MKRRGFTLIELIIVLAIISISFLILTFRFSVIDKIGAENEIKTFVNDYYYARDKAISSGVEVIINLTDKNYEIKSQNKTINRNLKYIKSLNTTEITIQESGYVLVNKTKEDHNLEFVSKKDPQKHWLFTIQAVGGYLNEKE